MRHGAVMERSAALALVRGPAGHPREVLLVHPGGPFWAKKHEGAWSLPKGLLETGEDALTAAKREFTEETGAAVPAGPFVALGEAKLKSGKLVVAFAAFGEFDVAALRSNVIEIEYPPRSGRKLKIPEVDRAEWADLEKARALINPGQFPLIERALNPRTWEPE
jgi:predicted NUDIX family NTP pyrophosphohydrolase